MNWARFSEWYQKKVRDFVDRRYNFRGRVCGLGLLEWYQKILSDLVDCREDFGGRIRKEMGSTF